MKRRRCEDEEEEGDEEAEECDECGSRRLACLNPDCGTEDLCRCEDSHESFCCNKEGCESIYCTYCFVSNNHELVMCEECNNLFCDGCGGISQCNRCEVHICDGCAEGAEEEGNCPACNEGELEVLPGGKHRKVKKDKAEDRRRLEKKHRKLRRQLPVGQGFRVWPLLDLKNPNTGFAFNSLSWDVASHSMDAGQCHGPNKGSYKGCPLWQLEWTYVNRLGRKRAFFHNNEWQGDAG